MSQLGRYAYINAKIHARVSRMLSEQKLSALSRSRSIEQLLHQLLHTPYEHLYDIYHETGDIQMLEAGINTRAISIHREIASDLDPTYSNLIDAFTRKLEIENLKGMIRLYFSNIIKGEDISRRVAYLYRERIVDDISWQALANARTFEEIRAALEHTPYSEVVNRFSEESIRKEGLFFLETGLDHIWVYSVLAVLPSLAREDRTIVSTLLDSDGDLKNLINIFRYHALWDLSPEELRRILYPAGHLHSSDEFHRLMEEDMDTEQITKVLKKRYPRLARELSAGETEDIRSQVQRIEQYLFIMRKSEYRRLLRGNPFTIGTILGYFFLSEQQDSVVKRLINEVQYSSMSDQFREAGL